jgi:hypothetical protein
MESKIPPNTLRLGRSMPASRLKVAMNAGDAPAISAASPALVRVMPSAKKIW